jgi:hypothetical protein
VSATDSPRSLPNHATRTHDTGSRAAALSCRCARWGTVGATTADGRAEWIAALDKLAALHPAAVVTGHKDPTQGNPPSVLAESRGYIEYYGKLREAGLTDQGLFDAMVSRYPDWVSRQQSLILG